MEGRAVLFCLLVLAFADNHLVNGGAGNIWGYQDGLPPALWPTAYRTCGGRMQSPINIAIEEVELDERLGLFDFNDLNRINNVRMKLENNGHTAEVDVEGANRLFIGGGGLPGRYIVKQFHFHWGSADRRGSEHDINGRPFPMEMHVVAYSDRYRMFEQAKNASAGLAVMSFLFDIGDENPDFEEIIGHLGNVAHKDDYVDINTFSLTSLFPPSTDVFYRYYGGLTTPPCYESVIWTIFQEHIRISERQINVFRQLGNRHFNRYRALSDNFRPAQPLNGRRVVTNDVRGMLYSRGGYFPRGGGGDTIIIQNLPHDPMQNNHGLLPQVIPINLLPQSTSRRQSPVQVLVPQIVQRPPPPKTIIIPHVVQRRPPPPPTPVTVIVQQALPRNPGPATTGRQQSRSSKGTSRSRQSQKQIIYKPYPVKRFSQKKNIIYRKGSRVMQKPQQRLLAKGRGKIIYKLF